MPGSDIHVHLILLAVRRTPWLEQPPPSSPTLLTAQGGTRWSLGGKRASPAAGPCPRARERFKSLNKEAAKTGTISSPSSAVAQLWGQGVPSLGSGHALLLITALEESSWSGTKVSKLKHLLPLNFKLVWGGSATKGFMARKVDTVRK